MDLTATTATALTLAAVVLPVAVALRINAREAGPAPKAKALADYTYWERQAVYHDGAEMALLRAVGKCSSVTDCESLQRLKSEARLEWERARDNAAAAKRELERL